MGTPAPDACRLPDAKQPRESKAHQPPGPGLGGLLRDKARQADGFDAGEAVFRPRDAPPKRERPANDISDPKLCSPLAVDAPLTETPTDQPPEAELFQLAHDAAAKAHSQMKTAVDLRLRGFLAASKHLDESADAVNEDKDAVLGFVEKAFEMASSALIGAALGKMAATGAVGVIKSILSASLDKGSKLVGSRIGDAAIGGRVSFADFNKLQMELGADAAQSVEQDWDIKTIRTDMLASRYPHREAEAAVAATAEVMGNAYRLQMSTAITGWANTVHAVKGGDAGVLELQVEFDESGTYVVGGGKMAAVGPAFRSLLTDTHLTDERKKPAPFTLSELLRNPTGGMKVVVRDQSGERFEWDPAQKAIATSDAHLMHHRVNRWGVKHVGQAVPVVYAHRFLFEVLGPRSLSDIGVGE